MRTAPAVVTALTAAAGAVSAALTAAAGVAVSAALTAAAGVAVSAPLTAVAGSAAVAAAAGTEPAFSSDTSAAEESPRAGPAPRLAVDLDAFDAGKRTATLSNGETLAYIDLGPRQGPAVVLIHGYTDNARDWVPILPYVSKHLRLVLVDIRGHGKSSKPECCYTRIDFAYDIKLLLDELHIDRADVVGHSLGSIIAQTFAEYWPEHTRRVVLIASTGGTPPEALAKKPAVVVP